MARQKQNQKTNKTRVTLSLSGLPNAGRMTDPETLIVHPKQCGSSVSDLIVLQCGFYLTVVCVAFAACLEMTHPVVELLHAFHFHIICVRLIHVAPDKQISLDVRLYA